MAPTAADLSTISDLWLLDGVNYTGNSDQVTESTATNLAIVSSFLVPAGKDLCLSNPNWGCSLVAFGPSAVANVDLLGMLPAAGTVNSEQYREHCCH